MLRRMETSLFDYHLPDERIAQTPVEPRDHAKLLCVERGDGTLLDKHVFDLPNLLNPGDLLIFNDSKVFKARLEAMTMTGGKAEVFLLNPDEGTRWQALIQPGKKFAPGDSIKLVDGTEFHLVEKTEVGTALIETHLSAEEVFALSDRIGSVPTPPYVDGTQIKPEQYQTVYAKERGSVAAPTAGLHFTPRLLEALEAKGVKQAFVTLHVGLGTFRPMKSDTLEGHTMHSEWIQVSQATVELIEQTKKNGGRVIAVGTTTVRALESAAQHDLQSFSGFTSMFITPGYSFKVIDGLLTNFHLPKSTLIVLVSSFAGRESTLNAYRYAVEHDYRFYSFGDAMLII